MDPCSKIGLKSNTYSSFIINGSENLLLLALFTVKVIWSLKFNFEFNRIPKSIKESRESYLSRIAYICIFNIQLHHVVIAPQKETIQINLKINMLDEIIKWEKNFYIVSIHQDIGKINHVQKIVHKQ